MKTTNINEKIAQFLCEAADATARALIFVIPLAMAACTWNNADSCNKKDDMVASLIHQLSDERPVRREAAAFTLLDMGPDAAQAYPALVHALTHDEWLDCRIASHALYLRQGKVNDIPTFIQVLTENPNVRGRAVAAWELSRLGPAASSAVPALISALSTEDKHARQFMAIALGSIGPRARDAVPGLVSLMKEENVSGSPQMVVKYPRAAAALALGMIGADAREAVPALIWLVEGGDRSKEGASASWEYQRAAACFALGEIGRDAKGAIPALVRALKDPGESVRVCAAMALGRIGPEAHEAVPALKASARDPEQTVHRGAGKALDMILSPRTISPEKENVAALMETLQTGPGRIRDSVKPALILLARSEATWTPIAKESGRMMMPVHESAALALGYLESIETLPMPDETVTEREDMDESIRNCLLALGALQQRLVSLILEILIHEDENVRSSAAEGLGAMGTRAAEALPTLNEVMSDEDWLVRRAAARSLDRLSEGLTLK